jgi:hypothetical protein
VLLFIEFQAKAYRDYAISKKNIDLLTEEDRFIYRLSHTERLATKLQVMCYMGNFFDNVYLITPVRLGPKCRTLKNATKICLF